MNEEFYYTIAQPVVTEFKDRGSRFLAYAYPLSSVDDFKAKMKLLKEEHPKAVHHCFAYRLGVDGNTFRVSDDGEPSGSAGKPILNQIYSAEVTNVLVAVVRYFGGTLLGVPGLIAAYKGAAAEALAVANIITHEVLAWYNITCPYTTLHEVMNLLKKENVTIAEQQMETDCRFKVAVQQSLTEKLNHELATILGVSVIFIEYA